MSTVASLWLIYLIIIVFILLIGWVLIYSTGDHTGGYGILLVVLSAALFGAVVVMLGLAWLNGREVSEEERVMLLALILIAISLPVFLLVLLLSQVPWRSIPPPVTNTTQQPCMMIQQPQVVQPVYAVEDGDLYPGQYSLAG